MTNKTAKRSLIMSVISLLLCCSMLIGTTFAWFTDTAVTGVNTIQSGKLDVVLEYSVNGGASWMNAEGKVLDFMDLDANELWEPGCTYEMPLLRVRNAGNLELKYQIAISGLTGDAKLLEVIEWTVNGETLVDTYTGTLAAGAAGDALLIKGHMLETAGNEYMDLKIENISITVYATQMTAENDSFGDQYDADADYVVYYTNGVHTLNTSLLATQATDVITVTGEGTVLNITGGHYDSADQECAVWAYDGGVVNIYDGEFWCDGFADCNPGNHQDMIYAGSNGGKINIYGGFFASREGAWLLNEKDNQGEIVVYGGTFVNWNPADNISEGANTSFLAENRYVIVEKQANGDVWYTVKEQAENEVLATPETVQDVVNNLTAEQVAVLLPGEYGTIVAKNNVTIKGVPGAVVDCINLNGADNVTLKNITFDAAGANKGYDAKGNFKQYANIISGGTSKNLKGSHNLVIDGCTFTGTFTNGGTAICFADQNRKSGASGNITIKNCTFDTVGAYYDIYGYYFGDGQNGYGDLVIENNTFKSADMHPQGKPIYLGKYASSTPVVIKGNDFQTKTSIASAVTLQDHSSYGVSMDAANNTFAY